MIKLNGSYLGFTNNIKPLQKGKIEKSLDMLVRYNNSVMHEKEFVILKLQEGYSPAIEENYTTWSRKLDGYTKPKTLYKLETEDGYQEINKTLYNFALYVIENNFTNDQLISEYIQEEHGQKAEQLRIEQEKANKEREQKEMQQQKEEQERKLQLEIKRKKWNETGKQLLSTLDINPITKVLDIHWNEIESIYFNVTGEANKESFYNEMNTKLIEMLGNPDYCIYLLQYYIANYNRFTIQNNIIQTLERDVLFKAFNIEINDTNRTITTKVKNIYKTFPMAV